MILNVDLQLVFLLLVYNISIAVCMDSSFKAKPLLMYDYQSEMLILNDSAVGEIEALRGPLRIISVIGDAYVGKSTTLNMIRHYLDGSKTADVQSVFKTCEKSIPCTSGVWMSVLPDVKNRGGNIILIDTEGTNFKDNEITDSFHIFSFLISSGLALFARERISSYNIKFLYRVSRLTEQFWEDDVHDVNSYPGLLVILRDALSPSPGNTLLSEIQNMIVNDRSNIGKSIGRFFPRDRIKVRNIPHVEDSKRLRDSQDDTYETIASSLAADFKRFPSKKNVRGGVIDGKMMADLIRKLHVTISRNPWSGVSNTYTALETYMCNRGFREVIEPLLAKEVDEIQRSKHHAMEQFIQKCFLAEEIDHTRGQIAEAVALKEKIGETQRLLDEEVLRPKEIGISSKASEEVVHKRKRLEAERAERVKAEEQLKILEERLNQLKEVQRQRETASKRRKDILGSVLGGAVLFGILSDSRLKENITILQYSEFKQIGLQGYSWRWSRKAAEQLGKRGQDHGVIAQEVEKQYPWAVATGEDGYKRVNYTALRQLLMLRQCQHLKQERRKRCFKLSQTKITERFLIELHVHNRLFSTNATEIESYIVIKAQEVSYQLR
ncbi:guanylate-binding protein 1-like [Stylophora pistillata]|uniref:guanylate-binding protein 1-like n=1 Tax=Stylophora pistillata TaxID=50429 RepID=UPI000C052618|nr:guanylate-binding protein 1-like [Stylophora pistillata]